MTKTPMPKIETSTQEVPPNLDYEAALEDLVALGMSRSEALAWLAFERGESKGDVVFSDTEAPTLDSRLQDNADLLEPALPPKNSVEGKY